jgi:uncharacterized protein
MDLILFHNACPDGFCAAFIAHKKYPEAELIALDHGLGTGPLQVIMEQCADKDVLMVDYSLRTRELNDELNSIAKSFRIFDHHKTAQVVLEGAPYAVFDMNRSGAGLTWDYLFGKDSQHWGDSYLFNNEIQKRPWYVDYVEDRDLWKWKLPMSREICAYLGTLEFTEAAWKELDGTPPDLAASLGIGALAHIKHFVRETIKNVRYGIVGDSRVAILNATYLNCSEIGNELAKMAAYSITWFERKDDIIQFSLRSIGDFDVSQIAKAYGGGGHKNASGFQLSYSAGRVLIDTILGRGNNG